MARSDAIDVMWGAASGAIDGYRLDVGPESDPDEFSQRFPSGTTSYTVSGLEPNTEYQVSVVSLSGNQESQPLQQVIRTSEQLLYLYTPATCNNLQHHDLISVDLYIPECSFFMYPV